MAQGLAAPLHRLARGVAPCCLAALLTSCFFDGSDDEEDGPLGGSHSVSGQVVDFQSGEAVSAEISLSTSGLLPGPDVTITGSSFKLTGIPANSAFQVVAGALPTYPATYSAAMVIEEDDLEDVAIPVVSAAFLAGLAASFSGTPTAARGVLLARVVDASGAPRAGVPAASFLLQATGVSGSAGAPKFLDATLAADPAAVVTSASGWVVFFELPQGVVSLGQATTSLTLEMATSTVSPNAVTIAEIKAIDGAPPALRNVSFATQIVPIFAARGCTACHSGGGAGKDLGGLDVGGGASKIYKELLIEDPTRVRPGVPEASLLLTMPSLEAPADLHPNVTFLSTADPDFQKIYVWIKEGAQQN
jgi:hypothetical protein